MAHQSVEGEEGRREGGEYSDNPLLAHMVFVKMEALMDNLKLLDYEKGFCKMLRFKPVSRHYFALPTNSGEQFYLFSNLAIWLLNLCGRKEDQPQEGSDPNVVITTIIEEAKKLKIPASFAPHKLKTGSGEQVCNILHGLSECALQAKHFQWKRPVHKETLQEEEVLQDESAEVTLSKLEEEIHEAIESEDEGTVFMDLSSMKEAKELENEVAAQLEGAMESSMDAQQWRLEVERVLPSLKVHHKHDNRDWRSHYDQMHHHQEAIQSKLADTQVYLDKLQLDIGHILEKISSREKYINNQLESQIIDFRSAQDSLAEVKERYSNSSSSVNHLAQELAQITEALDRVKTDMDERGSSMTDAGPLVRIKQALTKLKAECSQMDVRIGVIEHTLLQAQLKNKSVIQRQMNEPQSTF